MPNLDEAAARKWLKDWMPEAPGWPPIIRDVEGEDGIPERLAALGARLDAAAIQDRKTLSDCLLEKSGTNALRAVLAQFGAARMLRLLHWIQEEELPRGGQLLQSLLSKASPDGRALHAGFQAFHRQVTAQRLFAPDRLSALEGATAEAHVEDV